MTGSTINVQSRPSPLLWDTPVLIDRRYLATEHDQAIVTEDDNQIFVYDDPPAS